MGDVHGSAGVDASADSCSPDPGQSCLPLRVVGKEKRVAGSIREGVGHDARGGRDLVRAYWRYEGFSHGTCPMSRGSVPTSGVRESKGWPEGNLHPPSTTTNNRSRLRLSWFPASSPGLRRRLFTTALPRQQSRLASHPAARSAPPRPPSPASSRGTAFPGWRRRRFEWSPA